MGKNGDGYLHLSWSPGRGMRVVSGEVKGVGRGWIQEQMGI